MENIFSLVGGDDFNKNNLKTKLIQFMYKQLSILLVILYSCFHGFAQKDIIIEIDIPPAFPYDSAQIWTFWEPQNIVKGNRMGIKSKIKNGIAKFVIPGKILENNVIDNSYYTYVHSNELLGKGSVYYTRSGDSIRIKNATNGLVFSGKGVDKFQFQYEYQQIKKPTKVNGTSPLDKYLKISSYTDSIMSAGLILLGKYKVKITPFDLAFLEARLIIDLENKRIGAFKYYIISNQSILNTDKMLIYDTTIGRSLLQKIKGSDIACFADDYDYTILDLFPIEYERNTDFKDIEHNLQHKVNIFRYVHKNYKGLSREKFLYSYLYYNLIQKEGLKEEVMNCISDYFSQSQDSTYYLWMKNYVEKAKTLLKGFAAPNFTLTDANGKKVSLSDFKGKVVLLDFWFTGCVGCIEVAEGLKKVEEGFKGNPDVVFLSVSVDSDKSKWLKSIVSKKYTTGDGIQLYTDGLGSEHPITSLYQVTSYPRLFLISPSGAIVHYPIPRPSRDGGKMLTQIINKELAQQFDGPYVFYEGNKITSNYFDFKDGRFLINSNSLPVENKNTIELKVKTDRFDKSFGVTLKKQLHNEPSVYKKPNKLLILSDIEGNFEACKSLLQANQVIDGNFNWIYGNGQIVILGDLFDRGNQVTECLWLIYSLEEKAKAAGGYVHFILGNHEIMNLNGDTQYVQSKYKINASRLGMPYKNLYATNSELGKWLRTKNIIEKIGDILVVHGGIAPEINNLEITLFDINEMARVYYDSSTKAQASGNKNIKTIFDLEYSPFWYRFYYKNTTTMAHGALRYLMNKADLSQINKTLSKFEVNTIVTGHTIVADTVSLHYKGKVINVDTHHANGKSEALLVEGGKFYSVDALGQKKILVKQPDENFTFERSNMLQNDQKLL